MTRVSSWGRLTNPEHHVVPLSDRSDLARRIARSSHPGLAFGNGRSYGDSCLNPGGNLWLALGLDRYISFDAGSGLLKCEAGVVLRDIQRLLVPRGWILPVTPGTQLVTVGGAIANDVHGKNHHVFGSFGDCVAALTLLRTDGEVIECGPDWNSDWFAATVGGMGLTGLIVDATLKMRPCAGPWLDAETIPYRNLDEFFVLADESEKGWEQTVSWLDGISKSGGRGIFQRSNPVDAGRRRETPGLRLLMPFTPPVSLVNRLSLKPFNMMYYTLQKLGSGRKVRHFEPFSYPLDNVLEWNRMYGPRGFFQYQSVVPREGGRQAVEAMLEAIRKAGEGSFLAVLKTFGDREPLGMMSFPRPGVTLAMDFPNKGAPTEKLFERLDAIVREAGGRIYPAKDARMPKALFEAGFPRLNEFLNYRDPGISSALSRRLIGS
ncbi:MAG: FAD-binding oxidoreductase [Methylobacteriaceae bacterium]|jgi:FAD/FMN-containing dehydrogenase|nr:FAD-binding oxidoreductase [Methylobacteriaceae bacterium]